uniref:Uncharacterized protein n=1 Tax=Nothobranchius kuhntae TaxID=321403 RepID=A0A1A8I4X8_NOTKU
MQENSYFFSIICSKWNAKPLPVANWQLRSNYSISCPFNPAEEDRPQTYTHGCPSVQSECADGGVQMEKFMMVKRKSAETQEARVKVAGKKRPENMTKPT